MDFYKYNDLFTQGKTLNDQQLEISHEQRVLRNQLINHKT